MADKFSYKHKKKTLLALLLLFLRRAKGVLMVLFIAGALTTFVFSGNNMSKMLKFPPLAALAGLMGYDVGSVPSSSYSNEGLKNAFDKAAADSKSRYFRDKFFNREFLDSADRRSSLAMVGGKGILKGAAGDADSAGKGESKGKGGEGEKTDAVDFQDRFSGKNGEDVENGEGGTNEEGGEDEAGGYGAGNYGSGNYGAGGQSGAAGEGGLYGNVMGEHLANRSRGWGQTSKGAYAKNAPYIGKDFKSGERAANKGEGLVEAALTKGHVPSVGRHRKIDKRKMGSLSGFSWKKASYKGGKSKQISKVSSNKRAMVQVAETFSMTSSAYMSGNTAHETQASYSGSTYDGNDVNAQVLVPAEIGMMGVTEPELPDFTFLVKILKGGTELIGLSDECSRALEKQVEMGRLQSEIDNRLLNLGRSPDCCKRSAVKKWNDKLDTIKTLCKNFNAYCTIIASRCQASYTPQNCNYYDSKKVKPCKWITVCGPTSCKKICLRRIFQIAVAFAAIIVGIMLAIMTGGAAMAVGVGLAASGVALLSGQVVGGAIGAMLSTVGAVSAGLIGGPAALLVLIAATYINDVLNDDGSVKGDFGEEPDYDFSLDEDAASGEDASGDEDASEGDDFSEEEKASMREAGLDPDTITTEEYMKWQLDTGKIDQATYDGWLESQNPQNADVEDLKKLLDDGTITQEQYEEMSEELGGGESNPEGTESSDGAGDTDTGEPRVVEHEITVSAEELASGDSYNKIVTRKLTELGYTPEEIARWFESRNSQ